MSVGVDSLGFFDALADEMNTHEERFAPLGEAEMVVVLVMTRPPGAFCVRLDFESLGCSGVSETDEPDAPGVDFRLEGSLESWVDMFEDIATHSRATGPYTINSLALMGDRISCGGGDPMGLDKFSRFNQTLQEFFDGARHVAVGAS